jgi:hypothetical protein
MNTSSQRELGSEELMAINPTSNDNVYTSGVPRNFVRGGVQQIQLRTEDRENGDLGAVAP